jgi:hypothetical protein
MNRLCMRECEYVCKRRITTDNGQYYVSSYRKDHLSNKEKNVARSTKMMNTLDSNDRK